MNRKRLFWIAVWAVLVVVTGFLAFGTGPGSPGYGPWQGWGRMAGWNDDSRVDGAFGGYGMGPGMMGGVGWGMGQMPFGGMGWGRAGVQGTGSGPSAGGYAPQSRQLPNLTPAQAEQIGQIQREAEARNSRLMQQLWAAQDKLNLLRMSEGRDWKAIRAATHALFDLQRQQLDAAIDLQQQVDGLLTDSQRQDMARSWRGYESMGVQ